MNFHGLIIGVPKEILLDERRVAAIPETVKKLKKNGAVVVIERGAGEGSNVTDDEYLAAGAEIVDNAEEVFERSHIILKVKEPRFNTAKGKHEADMMKKSMEKQWKLG